MPRFPVCFESIVPAGGRSCAVLTENPLQNYSPNRERLLCGYLLMGAISGIISVSVFPMHLFVSPVLQILNLAITPLVLGSIFEATGRWRSNHDKPRYSVDRFSYGFTFALTMRLIRYFFAA